MVKAITMIPLFALFDMTIYGFIRWTIFGSSDRQRYFIFFLTCVAISFSSYFIYNVSENEYLLVNLNLGYVAVSLFVRERRAWPTTLALGLLGLILGVFLVGSASASSLTTVSIDVVVALLIALLSRRALRVSVHSRRVSKFAGQTFKNFLLATTQVGGVLVVGAVVMSVLQNVQALSSPSNDPLAWLLSRSTGIIILATIAMGVILEFHWGYSKLSPKLLPFPLVFAAFVGTYWFALTRFSDSQIQNPPATMLLFFGVILAIMPSLWQASLVFLILVGMWLPNAITVLGQVPVSGYLFVIVLSFIQSAVILGRIFRSRSEGEWRAAVNEGPVNLVGLDDDGVITYLNDKMASIFGVNTNAAIGQKISEIFPVSLQTDPKETLDNLPIGECILSSVGRDGSESKFLVLTTKISDPSLSFSRVASFRDVTIEKRLERERAEVQAALERALGNAEGYLKAGVNSFLIQDEAFKPIYMSEASGIMFGVSSIDTFSAVIDFYIGMNETNLRKQRSQLKALPTGKILTDENPVQMRATDGRVMSIRRTFRWFDNPTGKGRLLIAAFEDLTELENARATAEGYLKAGTHPYVIQDENFNFVFVSTEAKELLECSDNEELPPVHRQWIDQSEEQMLALRKELLAMPTGQIFRLLEPRRLLTLKGNFRYVTLQSRWFTKVGGMGRLLMVSLQDVTEMMESQARLTRLLDHDDLTAVLSRKGLWSHFADGKRQADLGLFLLDIDYFKSVNDIYGHVAGDEMLVAYAATLKDLAEPDGSVVRLGGEEFALLRPWLGWNEAASFAKTLRLGFADTSIEANRGQIQRTASIGYVLLEKDDPMTECLHLADLGLREAKLSGRNKAIAADDVFLNEWRSRGAFITAEEVRVALANGELRYFVQPIWDAVNNSIFGFEALIRWRKPDGTILPPAMFLEQMKTALREPRAIENQNSAVKKTFSQLSEFPNAYVAFNFTMDELAYKGAAKDLMARLDLMLDHPDRKMVIELSEVGLGARVDMTALKRELRELHEHGCLIALDDFGVESSNINRLQDLPIDIVKLDKSLIKDLDISDLKKATISGIVLTLNSLGMAIVAEGVETIEQAEFLYREGINLQQGYLHARPMPPEELGAAPPNIGQTLRGRL